jgi:hypothetical protein
MQVAPCHPCNVKFRMIETLQRPDDALDRLVVSAPPGTRTDDSRRGLQTRLWFADTGTAAAETAVGESENRCAGRGWSSSSGLNSNLARLGVGRPPKCHAGRKRGGVSLPSERFFRVLASIPPRWSAPQHPY